jgi:mycothiol synthase
MKRSDVTSVLSVNSQEKNLPLKMSRANLDNLPAFALPKDFSLRWYQPGDEAHWLRLHLAADKHNEITLELFQNQFGAGEKNLRERQGYLLSSGGEVIGTGTAWFDDQFVGGPWGRVHWMAILPVFQGRGLGKALLSAICRRLRELGHGRAYLSTSSARLAAIKLYLRFGFAPMMLSEEDEAAWKELLAVAARAS